MKVLKVLFAVFTGLMLNHAVMAQSAYEAHFDLHTQDFSETKKDGDMIWARYELPKSYVTTNLKHDTTYHTLDDSGFFKVELKQPLKTWGVTVDATYKTDSKSKYERRAITLTADNGASLVISIAYYCCQNEGVIFEDERIYSPSYDERLNISVSQDNAYQVTIDINGSVTKVVRPGFSNLKFVEVQLIQESGQNDTLNNLSVAGSGV